MNKMTRRTFVPLTLLMLSMVSCSSKSTTETPVAPTVTQTPTYDFNFNTTPQADTEIEADAVSSATVLEEDGHSGAYNIFYQNQSEDELLLDCYPSADYLVLQAISTPYVLDSDVPLDVIHQTIKESLGDRYESVRGNMDLLTRDEYYRQLEASENPTEITASYSKSLSDLSDSWYQGLSSSEIATLKGILLSYYDINDLLKTKHYSGVSGIDALVNFVSAMDEVETYLQTQSADVQESTQEIINRVVYQSDTIQSSEYATLITSKMTVRELLDIVELMTPDLQGELLKDSRNLSPERIGYYATSRHYGISIIESIQDEVSEKLYGNVVETPSVNNATSKSARLYLPLVGTDEYYVITIQEIRFDVDHIYTYLNVETATISTFNTIMAQDLHKNNSVSLSLKYGLEVEDVDDEVLPEDEDEDEDEDEAEGDAHGDDEDIDEMTRATPEFVTLTTPDATGGTVEITIPHFPEKVVILDHTTFDALGQIGVFQSYESLYLKDNLPSIMTPYIAEEAGVATGISADDLATIESFQPDVIFANKDSADIYDQLTAIAPVIMTDIDDSDVYGSYLENLARIASVFAVQTNVDEITNPYDSRLESLKGKASGQSAVVAIVSGGNMAVDTEYGNLIFQKLGMTNAAAHLAGQNLTADALSDLNPDYLFVLDLDNSFTSVDTTTVKLDITPWTMLDGGLLGMDLMISDLEKGIS